MERKESEGEGGSKDCAEEDKNKETIKKNFHLKLLYS
jgi:hypothetical protein